MLRRVYREDVFACPCGGRRRLVTDLSEREVVVAILKHLGLPSEPPPIPRARSPSCEAACAPQAEPPGARNAGVHADVRPRIRDADLRCAFFVGAAPYLRAVARGGEHARSARGKATFSPSRCKRISDIGACWKPRLMPHTP
ncbi:uncharacterized protein SOCE26_090320 [Sorangium cellulosum]|uniref:Uncharacterized protein n=1 Tax=Sorangium cellulosum TaxID=56 RepID=A0A2L0F7P2_SORCE|nr:uncharacterized protein SOCE26_090320 [Sorangium cellulosum]